MELIGKLKTQVDNAATKEEKREAIKKAGTLHCGFPFSGFHPQELCHARHTTKKEPRLPAKLFLFSRSRKREHILLRNNP